jgi:hypothetical protein
MSCRTGVELQQYLQSALAEGSPGLLLGLSEAGKRNRLHQREERILKLQTDLKRHKDSCEECRMEMETAEVAP